MKSRDEQFTEEFGMRLEKYVELGLKEVQLKYKNELAIKKDHSEKAVADFFIDDNILIECKATEIHPRSGVLRTTEILTKEFNHSIIKAYCQLLSTASSIDSSKKWYGIIITYTELFLGFGIDAWKEFLKEPVLDFCDTKKLDYSILPPENLFFIDIENWDYLIQIIKNGGCTFTDMFEKAKSLSNDPVTRLFNFEMVLKKYYPIKKINLSYLEEAHKLVDDYVENT